MKLKELDGIIDSCVRLHDRNNVHVYDVYENQLSDMFATYGEARVLSMYPFSEEDYGEWWEWLEIRIDIVGGK